MVIQVYALRAGYANVPLHQPIQPLGYHLLDRVLHPRRVSVVCKTRRNLLAETLVLVDLAN